MIVGGVKFLQGRAREGRGKSLNLLEVTARPRSGQCGRAKGKGFREGIFARPLFLDGGRICVAKGDVQVSQSFVQKRFALRPVIATK